MTKKILAMLTALTLCFGATSCSISTEEDGGASTAESSAAADSTGSNSAEEAENDESDDRSESDEGEPAGDAGMFSSEFGIDPKNIAVYTFENFNYDMLTDEEAATIASLIMEQYQAAFNGDQQRFIDLMSLEPFADIYAEIASEENGHYREFYENNQVAVIPSFTMLMLYGGDMVDIMTNGYKSKEEIAAEIHEMLKSPPESETAELVFSDSGYGSIPTLGSMDSPDDSTVVWMDVTDLARDGDDLYVSFIMGVFGADGVCRFMESSMGWYVSGQWGVLIGEAKKIDNPYEGMTAEEIRANPVENSRHTLPSQLAPDHGSDDSSESEELSEEEKALLDKAFNGLLSAFWSYNDSIDMYYNSGDDVEEMLKRDFPLSYSDEGLDLSMGKPAAEGDGYIYESMAMNDCTEGVVRLEKYTPEKEYMSVYYTSPNGTEISY